MRRVAVFRSDPKPLVRAFAVLFAAAMVLLLGAAAVGQVGLGRFPRWRELALIALAPWLAFVPFLVVMYAAVYLFPVTVFDAGLRSYNSWGWYRTVSWSDVRSVEIRKFFGFPYLFLAVADGTASLAVPLWLRDMTSFRELVSRHAGPGHPLSAALAQFAP